MSALNEADFGSDTDDDDYVPEGEAPDASEEENSGEEESTEDGATKVKKKKKSKKVLSGRKNIFAEEEGKVDWKKELEEERKEINEEKEKQKANDLFAAFKKDTSAVKAAPKKISSISSLFDSTPSTIPAPVVQNDPKKTSNRLASLFDDIPKSQPLSESNSSSNNSSKPKSRFGGLFDDEPTKEPVADQSDPSEALSDSKETKSDKIEIKKVFDFAGEMVTVSKEVEANSTEAKKYLKSQQEEKSAPEPGPGAKRPGGLAGIVGSIGKKQKMGVLDKSKLDWNSFVKEEGIKEELTTHNKGKDG